MQTGESHNDLLRQFVHDALVAKATGSGTKLYDQLVAQIRRLKSTVCVRGPQQQQQQQQQQPDLVAAEQLAHVIQAITHYVAIVHERTHEVLLHELLDIPLWLAPAATRFALLDFITHAVVANGALVHSCLHTLVYSLLPPPGPADPDPNPGQEWTPLPTHADIQNSVVTAAERVLELVPTAAARMLPLLATNFPHRLRDRTSHCLYFRALFALAESRSGAGLREGILASVVDHLITVDVEIRWEDIVDVPTEEAKEEEGGTVPGEEEPDIFELEGMTEMELAAAAAHGNGGEGHMPGGGWEGGQERGAASGAAAAGAGAGIDANGAAADGAANGDGPAPPPVDETADKLDSMMELTIQHIARRVASGQLPNVWETSLAAFERTVLHTHRSKFTQFLMFHLARHAPEPCCHAFLHLLLARLTDRMQPPVTRSACAAYAASFLARAAFVPETLVVDALQRLADWCLKYVREEDRRGGLPPIPSASSLPSLGPQDARERHSAFFAACQALLYALCYHMEPLLMRHGARTNANGAGNGAVNGNQQQQQQQENGAAPAPTANAANDAAAVASERERTLAACAEAVRRMLKDILPPLLAHPLDPLSSIARSVVIEFGRQTRALGHPQVTDQVRNWDRRRRTAGARHNARPLEVFFPFDPYLLQRSARLLDLPVTYVRWRRGHPAGAPRACLGDNAEDGGAGEGVNGVNGTAGGNGGHIDDDDDMLFEGVDNMVGDSADDSSGLEDSSSSDDEDSSDSSGTSSSSSTSSDNDTDDSSSDDEDDPDGLKRSRFGSMPDSSLSSGGRRRRGRGSGGGGLHRRLPGALKASLAHGGGAGGSPTLGMPIPGGTGSLSTDNGSNASPWGVSPAQGFFAGSFAPMSFTGPGGLTGPGGNGL